jgi:hypothetical protein
MLRASIAAYLLCAANAIASDRLGALLAQDAGAEAERAFSSGDRRHIVVPVCTEGGGQVIPGWPLHDSPEVRRAMDSAKRPFSCSDFGEDPKRRNFVRAAKWAERYNGKLLELEQRGRK